jgi:RNA polymerase sigma factor (sigma-70 family)
VGERPPNDWDPWSDEELVKLAVGRSPKQLDMAWAAFEELYQRRKQEVHDTIYSYLCRCYLTDHDLAWQFTQETFMKAWDTLPRKKTQSPFVPWIKLVGINQARQYMRKQGKITALTEEQNPFPDLSSPSAEEQVMRLLLTAELQNRIARIKARLTKQQLKVFNMHHEDGLSPREIALRLKLEPATIWQTLSRANKRFTEEWLKEGPGGDIPLPALKQKSGGSRGTTNQS